jgi:cytochrome c peroxidase
VKKRSLLVVLCAALSLAAGTGPSAIRAEGGFLANGLLPPVPVPPDNPQTDSKVRLGAELYFDTRLSADDTISCATCHSPDTAWANHHPTDTGIRGQVGGRNSGTVLDSAYMRYQFWDGRAGSLEEQALGPIHNPIEMGETLENVVRKLNAIPGYRAQFQEVFGTEANTDGIAKAIAAFERTVVSGPSPYDRYLLGEKDAMGAAAARGMQLFNGKAHCTPCHSGPAFSDQSFHNLGVGMNKPNPDLGRENHTKKAADRGRFKTPGLRNVALTHPYLHDGSAKTLLEVIDVYDRGGEANPDLDPLMLPLKLTAREKADLVAFLEALTGTLPAVKQPALPEDGKPGDAAPAGGAR